MTAGPGVWVRDRAAQARQGRRSTAARPERETIGCALMYSRVCLAALLLLVSTFVIADEAEPAALYIVHFETGENWDESVKPSEQNQFREHSANLNRLREEGTIVFGARYGELGLIIITSSSLESAVALMAADPGVKAGIFEFRVEPLSVFYPWRPHSD